MTKEKKEIAEREPPYRTFASEPNVVSAGGATNSLTIKTSRRSRGCLQIAEKSIPENEAATVQAAREK